MRPMGKMFLDICLVTFAAVALLGCQSGGEPKEDSQAAQMAKKQEPTGPAVTGSLASPPVSGLGFQRAILSLEVAPSGQVSGSFEGGYEEKPFEVPVAGEVADGTLVATGKSPDGAVSVSGPLEPSGFSGEVTGEIFTEQFSLPLAAEPAATE